LKKKYDKSYEKGDDLDKQWMKQDGISYVIPFNKRGKVVIKTWDEAKQAAFNMSKHLS
jgi:hypothetical protein